MAKKKQSKKIRKHKADKSDYIVLGVSILLLIGVFVSFYLGK